MTDGLTASDVAVLTGTMEEIMTAGVETDMVDYLFLILALWLGQLRQQLG